MAFKVKRKQDVIKRGEDSLYKQENRLNNEINPKEDIVYSREKELWSVEDKLDREISPYSEEDDF